MTFMFTEGFWRAAGTAAHRSFARVAAAGALTVLFLVPDQVFAKAPPESFADLAERLLPAVVNIATTQTIESAQGVPGFPQLPPGSPLEDFFRRNMPEGGPQRRGPSRRAQSLGSGFIIDPKGIVITNNHVIAEADEITVRLQDETEYVAKVIGKDPKTDVAVLQVDTKGKDLPYVKFGNSDNLRVGDWVVAIGNPFGLGGTVTAGIVSARGRDIGQGPYDDFIQTDASINRGNSGGPLFNLEGEVIGINTAIFSQSGGSIGIGFAVSSELASNVVSQIREFGRTRRGWLGVRIQQVSDDLAESLGLDGARGALVADVTPDGPAESAGVKPGDIILKFDGKDVPEMKQLPRIVAETNVGTDVDVQVWRDGKLVRLSAKLGELEEAEKTQLASVNPNRGTADKGKVDALGLELSALSEELRGQYDLGDGVQGVVVTGVQDGGSAAEKGLREGDVIVEFAQNEVSSVRDIANAVEAARSSGQKTVLVLMDRQGDRRFVALKIGG